MGAVCPSRSAASRGVQPVAVDEAAASENEKIRMERYASIPVPPLNPERVAFLAKHEITIKEIQPMGALVRGFDLRAAISKEKEIGEVLEALQQEMATRGFLVFQGQGVLTGDEQVQASELWGGREIHSTHGVHPKAPNKHIFRLSNDPAAGILGVGPQWHNDGSFEVGVFSHVGYHIVKVPEKGGDTMFCHLGAAFDALPAQRQRLWETLVSVNATSGVLHPAVHKHPISGRKSIYLHLGMTGGVLEEFEAGKFRLLTDSQLRRLMNEYNDLLNAGQLSKGGNYTISYPYEEGDCIFIDNLAIAHRASEGAHAAAKKQGLRVLHRTTVKAMRDFLPGRGLPPTVTNRILQEANSNAGGRGAFVSGGLGFRWDDSIRMQN
eukprot:TRINITY_DN47578_c0_g1_i2.p1 TRINITY_DN47578_c0_g1~~TRINITY_DN47578_c0_g1_i2.p1  ORF type:complete len:380 (-),score=34.06 TRINITY_DN47578_c0_g1_i2:168-1307(-)